MSAQIKIDLDIKPVLEVMRGLSDRAMQQAWRRTLRKTSAWVKTETARAVSKATQIPQKVLKQRLYFFLRSRDQGKVWLGLNPVEAQRLGTPRQTRKGVRVGKHSFDGAWLMSKRAPAGPVYRRTGKARLSYAEVKMDWDTEGEAAFRAAAARVQERVMVVLRQEVNYEIQKALGRISGGNRG